MATLPRLQCGSCLRAMRPTHIPVKLTNRVHRHRLPVMQLPVGQIAPHQAAVKGLGARLTPVLGGEQVGGDEGRKMGKEGEE